MLKTNDIKELFKTEYALKNFRTIGNNVQQSTTIELQGACFKADKPWIIREPNYEYANREIEWYKSQSLNVDDIPGGAPKMWKSCADKNGFVNSNYGWCIWSKENGNQYGKCLEALENDPHTREACMIYNRPSMQYEYSKNGMHDFMCTYAVQVFINENKDGYKYLAYHVFQRSQDAVFGFNNDILWHQYVQRRLASDLESHKGWTVVKPDIVCHVGSLHMYERHFKYLD